MRFFPSAKISNVTALDLAVAQKFAVSSFEFVMVNRAIPQKTEVLPGNILQADNSVKARLSRFIVLEFDDRVRLRISDRYWFRNCRRAAPSSRLSVR